MRPDAWQDHDAVVDALRAEAADQIGEIEMRILPSALPLCVVLALVPYSGVAQTGPADAAKGLVVAQTWCSNCHLVDPNSRSQANDVAPSFAAIARTPSTTSISLHAFLLTPHPPMPDYRLSTTEIDDLTAYILSLRDGTALGCVGQSAGKC